MNHKMSNVDFAFFNHETIQQLLLNYLQDITYTDDFHIHLLVCTCYRSSNRHFSNIYAKVMFVYVVQVLSMLLV